jgi:hypothetical protein
MMGSMELALSSLGGMIEHHVPLGVSHVHASYP